LASYAGQAQALVESQAFEQQAKCQNSGQNFWQLRKVEAPLGTVPASYPPSRSYHLKFSQFGCDLGEKG
jgi:hypothetical protein